MALEHPSVTSTESVDATVLTVVCGALVMSLLVALMIGWSWAVAPERSLFRLGAILLALPWLSLAIGRVPYELVRGWLRLIGLLGLVNVLFAEMEFLQLVVVHRWFDEAIVSLEVRWFGRPIVDGLQGSTPSIVLEGLMFAYVGYAVCLPLVGLLCQRGGGTDGLHRYLVHLSLTMAVCYLGFLCVPLAGPVFSRPEAFPTPLQAGAFTWTGEWIRQHLHFPGGSLPSPHCAATTVMLMSLWRFHRTAAYVLLPTLLSVYLATVIGRYHYVWDGIAGIAVAAGLQWVTDRLLYAVRGHQRRARALRTTPGRFTPSAMTTCED